MEENQESISQVDLSEADIKQVMLLYLKQYYRLRPRSDKHPLVTGLDLRGEGGLIADGFLSYHDEQENQFFAAFEATSRATREETVFRTRWALLAWDVGAATLFIVVAAWLILHAERFYLMLELGVLTGLGFVLLTAFLVALLLAASLHRFKRYRYIYAIEQFKQYHAEDQWVAIGYDVFDDTETSYYKELRRQCVRYGFGLTIITAERRALLIMAPSRAEIIKARRSIGFVAFNQVKTALGGLSRMGFVQKTRSRFNELIRPYTKLHFKWFSRPYYHQWAIVLISLVGLGLAGWHEWSHLPFRYVNERWYQAHLAKVAETNRPEPDYYLIDAPIALFGQQDFEPFSIHEKEEQFDGLIQGVADLSGGSADGRPIRILSAEPGSWPVAYPDCSHFYLRDTTLYILEDTFLNSLKNARSRLLDVNAYGLSASAVWSGCFRGMPEGYILYIDQIYADSARAYRALDSLGAILAPLNHSLKIRVVD